VRAAVTFAALAVSAVGLSGCLGAGGLPGSGSGLTQFNATLDKLASDPRCGHTDRVQGNLGGLTGSNLAVFFERTCPPGEASKPAASQ
jgi:hypothetical protein